MHAVITGSTSGLGAEVALQLKILGWNLTLMDRNRERGQTMARGLPSTFIHADLSLLHSLPQVSRQVQEPIDAMILCAGSVSFARQPVLTREGDEQTFATGHLSRFVLSQLLLDHLAPEAVVLMVGGQGTGRGVPTDWAFAHSGMAAALKTALVTDLHAAEPSRRHQGLRVHTCYLGMVTTNLFRQAPLPMRLLVQLFGQKVEQGSAHLTRLVQHRIQGVHWKGNQPLKHRPALPASLAENLWVYGQEVLNKVTREAQA